MIQPKVVIDEIEAGAALTNGGDERYFGYAVIGLPFDSGNILALRRFPASSIGPGYTSVWHRDPEGSWTFYQDVPPELACSRYYGNEIEETVERPIEIKWDGPSNFTVRIDGERSLEWRVTTRTTLATRLLNRAARLVPLSWWRSPTVLSMMGAAARVGLGAGILRLTGRLPNGQTYIANPSMFWLIDESRASIDGVDLGRPAPLSEQGRVGEFLIPQRGIFAVTRAYIESFDPVRHLTTTSKAARAVHLSESQ
jgi:hypothetical protein